MGAIAARRDGGSEAQMSIGAFGVTPARPDANGRSPAAGTRTTAAVVPRRPPPATEGKTVVVVDDGLAEPPRPGMRVPIRVPCAAPRGRSGSWWRFPWPRRRPARPCARKRTQWSTRTCRKPNRHWPDARRLLANNQRRSPGPAVRRAALRRITRVMRLPHTMTRWKSLFAAVALIASAPASAADTLPPQDRLAAFRQFDTDGDSSPSRQEAAAQPEVAANFDRADVDRDDRLEPGGVGAIRAEPQRSAGKLAAPPSEDEMAGSPPLAPSSRCAQLRLRRHVAISDAFRGEVLLGFDADGVAGSAPRRLGR